VWLLADFFCFEMQHRLDNGISCPRRTSSSSWWFQVFSFLDHRNIRTDDDDDGGGGGGGDDDDPS